MATPYVSGLAALVWSAKTDYTNAQVTYILTATADKVGPYSYTNGWNEHYGYGRINAHAAVALGGPYLRLSKAGPELAEVGEPVTYTLSVTNMGVLTATGLVLTDVLPVGAGFLEADQGGVLVGDVVSWTIPSLAPGVALTRTFAVTATGRITNTDYGVSSLEGVSAYGSRSVVTLVRSIFRTYLPLVLKAYQAP